MAALTLWLRTRSGTRAGKRGREHDVFDGGAMLRWTAFARRVPGPMDVFAAADPETPVLRGRPRRSFPLTGRYDVTDGTGAPLGVITRSGRFYDADGAKAGRFRDARSLKEHVGEGLLNMVVEGVIAGDAASGEGTGATAYALVLDGLPVGRLNHGRLPFLPPGETIREPGRLRRGLARVMPGTSGRFLDPGPPSGWHLDVPDRGPISEELLLAAAILAVEVALW